MKKAMFFAAAMLMFCMAAGRASAQVANAATVVTVATDASPLMVGEVVPDAPLVGVDGRATTLYSLVGERPTIVVFYRGEWCGNCTNHFKETFVPHLAEIESMGYNLVAVSPDAPAGLMATSAASGLDGKYLFGDGPGVLSKGMGLAWAQQERLHERLTASSGGLNTEFIVPVTALYVVEPLEKKVAFAHITPLGIATAGRIQWPLLGSILRGLKS
ncbi:MAG: redoxin domain-containing protein [Alistipes sp.]|jgi:peroxiredoxin|nr:redoxin domain-containing protein [Alistipes sp.]